MRSYSPLSDLASDLRYDNRRYRYRKIALLAWVFLFIPYKHDWIRPPLLMGMAASIWCLMVPRMTYRRSAAALKTTEDLSLLPTWIECLIPGSHIASAPLISPLTRLLHQVGPEDALYLSPKHRTIL